MIRSGSKPPRTSTASPVSTDTVNSFPGNGTTISRRSGISTDHSSSSLSSSRLIPRQFTSSNSAVMHSRRGDQVWSHARLKSGSAEKNTKYSSCFPHGEEV